MDSDVIIFITTFILLPLLPLVVSLFLSIPKSLESFQKLKHTHKATDFSLMIFWGALSISFLLFVYLISIRASLGYESYIKTEIAKIVAGIFITYLIFYFFVPKVHYFFHRWKTTQKPVYFSLMILFGLISFYLLSMISLKFILSAVGGLNV